MNLRKTSPLAMLALAALSLAAAGDDDKEKKDDKAGPLVVTDAQGKDHKIKDWNWKAGTRRLGWLAEDGPKPKDKKKGARPAGGPEALAIREGAIEWKDGVMTLVPMDRVRSVVFDNKRKTVVVNASAGDKGDGVALKGDTSYPAYNKFTLEAEVDKGEAGVAEVVFQGGVKDGFESLKFPAAKVEPIEPGRPCYVETVDKEKAGHKVSDLMPLYELGDREKLSPTLMFRKTLKLDVTKLRSIAAVNTKSETVWQVTGKDGEVSSLVPLAEATIDGQAARLLGLVGKTDVGYKLFPLRRIVTIQFDTDRPRGEQLPPPVEEGKEQKKDEGKKEAKDD